MNEIEARLRETMRSHANALQDPPAIGNLSQGGRSPKRRPALVAVLAAAIALGAGVAISQVVGDRGGVVPITERFLLATGDGEGGTWSLTAYQAQVTDADGGSSIAWCLDLEASVRSDAGSPGPYGANVCRSVHETSGTPIGEHALFPQLAGDQGLLYGWVSPEVERLQMTSADGVTRDLDLISPPQELGIGGAYFAATVPSGTVQLVAFSSTGAQLQVLSLGEPEAG